MACMAALQPDSCLTQSCKCPAAVLIFSLRTHDIGWAINQQRVSPIPIGLMPEHLSKAISLPATRTKMQVGSTYVVHSCFAMAAMAEHKSFEHAPKEEQKSLPSLGACIKTR